MNDAVKWQGATVEVQARLVPCFLWSTASIEVFLGGRPILSTGGQFNFTGSHSVKFSHAGATHTAELSWGTSGLRYSFPYQLRIDGIQVSASRAHIRNWQIGVIAWLIITGVMVMILKSVFKSRG